LNENANPLHRPPAVGDWVIIGKGEEYAGLTGQIKEIILLGSPEHDTGNPADDIVVDLSLMDYSDNMKGEIAALMRTLGYETDSYGDVSIDSVIVAPDDLIRVTEAERLQYEPALTESLQSAGFIGETLSSRHIDELSATLINRVEQNYAEYHTSLLGFGQRELIDMAAAIHAYSDAYSYMTAWHGFDLDELSFYLQFENPLSIVAESWRERNSDLDEMTFTTDYLSEPERRKLSLEVYPLYTEKPKQEVEITMVREADLTPRQRLERKVSKEFGDFLWKTERKSPNEIVEAGYEKVFKEDILLTLENGDFSDEQINALLSLDTPLADLYRNWLDTDYSYMDMLRDSMDEYIGAVITEQKAEKPCRLPKGSSGNLLGKSRSNLTLCSAICAKRRRKSMRVRLKRPQYQPKQKLKFRRRFDYEQH
jgi:hypothetical protein